MAATVAMAAVSSLYAIRTCAVCMTLHVASIFGHSAGANKSGKNGRDVEIKVPAGTQLYSDETGELIGEITTDQDRLVVAKGGKGGRGNARFATATHQAPREWEQGQLGHEMHILLELKLIADVGLVGLPNAGKSTLLSRLSNARPKVADYPFTTLQPNLGVVHYKDAGAFVIADIPGLIEGAHEGKGLGLEFLRHIERTKVLVFLVDMASETPWQDFQTLNSELESHDLSLLQKPRIVCLNKIDAVDQNSHAAVMREFESIAVHQLSAVTGDGVERVLDTIWRALQAESK